MILPATELTADRVGSRAPIVGGVKLWRGLSLSLHAMTGTNLGSEEACMAKSGPDRVTTASLRTPKLPRAVWTKLDASCLPNPAHCAFDDAIELGGAGTVTSRDERLILDVFDRAAHLLSESLDPTASAAAADDGLPHPGDAWIGGPISGACAR